MEMLLPLIGLAVVLVLFYVVQSGKPIPPAFRMLALVMLGIILLVCLFHISGCELPGVPR